MAKIKPISDDLILHRMRLENPWWETGSIPEYYKQMKRRLYFDLLVDQIEEQRTVKRAVVLMGPRRVGKTVMLYQVIEHLIRTGHAQRKICYLSIDAPIYNNTSLEELFSICRKAVGDEVADDFVVIFDEIQYLKNWEVHLKSLVDFYPRTRFIVSGSAAAALKLKSNESGAGRFTDFMLPPLTFQEYLVLKDLDFLIGKQDLVWKGESISVDTAYDIKTLNDHFLNYINFGGYPEVIFNDAIQRDPGRYIRSDIIDKVLLRDLPSLYGIRDVQELNSLFNVIAYNSGNEFNLDGLTQQSGVEKPVIRKYLEYLEAAFLVKILYPVGINTKRFQRDSRFKVYLTNPSMRCALFAPISAGDEQFGQMVETAIVAQWLHRGNMPLHFAAWTGGEVDLVMVGARQKPAWALEVKWSNQYYDRPNKLKSLTRYCSENDLEGAWVTTIDKTGERVFQDLHLMFYPAASYCYIVGKNSLHRKKTGNGIMG